jgi:hypothetical protein
MPELADLAAIPAAGPPRRVLNLGAGPFVNRTKPPLRLAAMAWVGEEDGASYVVGGMGKDTPGS